MVSTLSDQDEVQRFAKDITICKQNFATVTAIQIAKILIGDLASAQGVARSYLYLAKLEFEAYQNELRELQFGFPPGRQKREEPNAALQPLAWEVCP